MVPVSTQIFQCFGCLKESCQFCGVDWKKHADYGYVCDDVEGDDEAKVRLKTEEAMTGIFTRKCHQCSALLLKEGGCNWVTCKCGASMCYSCGKPDCPHGSCRIVGSDDVGPLDVKKVEEQRLRGEKERDLLGVKNRKKIGGD